MKDKKQGRKFNREKWDWNGFDEIVPSNAEIVKRFETFLEEQEAKEREIEVSKARKRAKIQMRKENAQNIIALSLVSIVGIFVGWWLASLIIKFVI